MAYPTVSAPYGLKPINLIGGQVFAGATRLMEIASGYNANIFYGDFVKRVIGGTIQKDTGTVANTPVGVFLGVSFTNASTGQVQQQQYYPASQAIASGTRIWAIVCDDPDTLFQVAVCSSGTTMATVTQAAIGTNMSILATAGSTTSGNSSYSVLSTSPALTATFPVRVIDVVPATAPSGTTYSEVIVKINFGIHQYNNATALAVA
jgi:hypothetical protein